ncbi:response regulator [Brumimicrobium oceani]|uniref:histidine kinase n=1 Tax=Brumimicrobium oceani TaxID=2100725 RepID=A0A2U2XGE6_9FLAO|nr:response regulator [Brumimicrobium oceani]PWH86810.1 hypothetical protein DIT68_00680 [Brumimicrobium oceani]
MESLIFELVNQYTDGVQVSDIEGNLVYLNSVSKNRLGIHREYQHLNVVDFETSLQNKSDWDKHVKKIRDLGHVIIRTENINLETKEVFPVEVDVFLKNFEGKEYILAISKDIKTVLATENKLFRREQMLKAIAEATKILSFNDDFFDSISKSLPILGKAVNVDRTYLFEFHDNEKGEKLTSQRLEWNSGTAKPQINNKELQNLNVDDFNEFIDYMIINEPYQAVISELPETSKMKPYLASQDIETVLIIPIYQKNKLWGMVGYDDCQKKRIWDESEISILSAFSSNIAQNLERQANLKLLSNLADFPLQSPDPVIRIDLEGNIILKNQTSNEIEKQEICIDGKNKIAFKQLANQVIKDIKVNNVERQYNVITENTTHYTLNPKFIKDKGHINLYFNDITALVQAKSKLENAQKIIDNIVTNIHDVIWSVNLENREVLFISPAIKELIGLSVKEVKRHIKNLRILKFLNKDDLINISRTIRHKGNVERAVCLDIEGKKKWINLRITAEKDSNGEILRLDGYIIDITLQHKLEENLKSQEKRFRGIIENIDLGLIEIDKNLNISYVNTSFQKIHGDMKNTLIGKNIKELLIENRYQLNEIDKASLLHQHERAMRGKDRIFEITVNKPSKNKATWLIHSTPKIDEHGKIDGVIGVIIDITEQKQIQQKLEEAKKTAEESNLAKEQFITNMSHEIRTPLNAILGISNLLKRFQQEEEAQKYINHLISSGNHLQSLIDNVLDFSKINAGKLSLNLTKFNFQEVFDEINSILLPLAKEKGLKFNRTLSSSVCKQVIGDRTRIKQIIINILSNAVKFTEKGIISFEVNAIPVVEKNQSLIITVKDTGIGMSQAFISTIFTKFAQEDSSNIRKESGTGLGMSISHEFIKLMKGSISIDSKQNEGTTIRMDIPVGCDNAANTTTTTKSIVSKELRDKKILIVEDNTLNLMLTKKTLEKYKVNIFEAKNGVEAIQQLKSLEVDLILMDIQMPLKDGIETTKTLINEMNITTPIIALSANAFKAEIDSCYNAGMVDYLTKPYVESELINLIQKHVFQTTLKSN